MQVADGRKMVAPRQAVRTLIAHMVALVDCRALRTFRGTSAT